MKKNILFLFFTVGTLCTNAQKLTQENIPGTWQTQSITSPSGIYYNVERDSLSLPPSMLASLKKEGMDSSAVNGIKDQLSVIKNMLFVFNTDAAYAVVNTANPAKTDSMETGKYSINGSKGLIFKSDKDAGKSKKIKAYFKNGYLILHAPGQGDGLTIFELKKTK